MGPNFIMAAGIVVIAGLIGLAFVAEWVLGIYERWRK